jgi:hypothetical protein
MAAAHDPPEPPPGRIADPTRDIRLPPLPDRPGPALPPQWDGLHRPAGPVADQRLGGPVVDQPTDRLASSSLPPVDREPTLELSGSPAQRWAAGHAAAAEPAWSSVPAGPGPVIVSARPRSRRWPWVVLTLVPLLVIAGTGLWLLLYFR